MGRAIVSHTCRSCDYLRATTAIYLQGGILIFKGPWSHIYGYNKQKRHEVVYDNPSAEKVTLSVNE